MSKIDNSLKLSSLLSNYDSLNEGDIIFILNQIIQLKNKQFNLVVGLDFFSDADINIIYDYKNSMFNVNKKLINKCVNNELSSLDHDNIFSLIYDILRGYHTIDLYNKLKGKANINVDELKALLEVTLNIYGSNEFSSKSNMVDEDAYRSLKKILKFFSPNICDKVYCNKKNDDNTFFRNTILIGLILDKKLLKDIPNLSYIYHEDCSRKTYEDGINDKLELYKVDPLLSIERKVYLIGENKFIGMTKSTYEKELSEIVTTITDMNHNYYTYFKNLINDKIRVLQVQKKLLSNSYQSKDSNIKEYLEKSERYSKQQNFLHNVYIGLLNYSELILSKVDFKKDKMTVKEATDILSSFIGFKFNRYTTIEGIIKHKIIDYDLASKVENKINAYESKDLYEFEDKLIKKEQLVKLKLAFETCFPKDFSRIVELLNILEEVYYKIDESSLHRTDELINKLETLTRYLNYIDSKNVEMSRYEEVIIGGVSYIKGLKKPEKLEFERVALIMNNHNEEKINKTYNSYLNDYMESYKGEFDGKHI